MSGAEAATTQARTSVIFMLTKWFFGEKMKGCKGAWVIIRNGKDETESAALLWCEKKMGEYSVAD